MFEQITKGTVKGKAIVELQNLRYAFVDGAADTVDILVQTGHVPPLDIAANDTVVAILEYDLTGLLLADRIGQTFTLSAGNINFASYDSSGKKLLIVWFAKPVGSF